MRFYGKETQAIKYKMFACRREGNVRIRRMLLTMFQQVTDTPGLLARPDDERNKMELLTLATLRYLPSSVVFVIVSGNRLGWLGWPVGRLVGRNKMELLTAATAALPALPPVDLRHLVGWLGGWLGSWVFG